MNLSDKIGSTHLQDYFMEDGEHGCNPNVLQYFCSVEDIRKSIKKLKKGLDNWSFDVFEGLNRYEKEQIEAIIDKVFGSKLI